MYTIDDIVTILDTAGVGVEGEDLFVYHSPPDVDACIIVMPSAEPPEVSLETPYYFKGRFQTIVRNDDYVEARNLCRQIEEALTLFNVETADMVIKQCRPLSQARAFRRSPSGMLEWSINFDIRYTEKD